MFPMSKNYAKVFPGTGAFPTGDSDKYVKNIAVREKKLAT